MHISQIEMAHYYMKQLSQLMAQRKAFLSDIEHMNILHIKLSGNTNSETDIHIIPSQDLVNLLVSEIDKDIQYKVDTLKQMGVTIDDGPVA